MRLVAQLVIGKVQAAGTQGGVDRSQDRWKIDAGQVQQACVCPDRIIGTLRIEFGEQQLACRQVEAFAGLAGHGLGPVGRIDRKPAFDHARGIPATPAAEFKDLRTGIKPVEECVEKAARPLAE